MVFATKIINNGLTNSTGWNQGKKNKSSHLFDPLISTPNKGIKKSNKIDTKNNNDNNFINLFFSWIEKAKSKNKAIDTKIRCFIKKKYICLFIFSATTEEVDENEKNNPSKNKNVNKNRICLSIFLHHFANLLVFSLLKLNM